MPEPALRLSLLILCYQSEDYAREFVRRALEMMDSAGIEDFELVLVGNFTRGSNDRTPEVVRELLRRSMGFIPLPPDVCGRQPHGYGGIIARLHIRSIELEW